MPIFKRRIVFKLTRGMKAFLNLKVTKTSLNLKVGVTRGAVPGRDSRAPGEVNPENLVWVFGTGRTGSTWFASMVEELKDQTVWREPRVGEVFGSDHFDRHKVNKNFILGDRHKETWLRSIRTFVLEGAAARFPGATDGGYLVIKEPRGSVGAPLLMKALPESRMVLLVRDPRDVVASWLDAFGEGGWQDERRKKWGQDHGSLIDENPDPSVEHFANTYMLNVGNAREAYDAHEGRKALVRYEDLRADTLETMRRMYAELKIPVDTGELARAVEKHTWESIPEEKKGAGKFYRKAKSGSWEEDLIPRQVELVESITAPLLDEFYPGWKNGRSGSPPAPRPDGFVS